MVPGCRRRPGRRAAGAPGRCRAGGVLVRYDPADPTPSAGGQLANGQREAGWTTGPWSARPDVLVFTGPPLAGALVTWSARSARGSGPAATSAHFDVFARLCDVDPRGRSRNVCDGIIRHQPGGRATGRAAVITVPMSATAYQFRAGHRLRLQVSGGAHPRFARNTGSGEPPATALPGWPRWTCGSCTRSAIRPCCRFRSCART